MAGFSFRAPNSALSGGDFQGMGVFRSDEVWGARARNSRALYHRLDEPHQVIPRHGCIPTEPASVSLGGIIVAPPRHLPITTFHRRGFFRWLILNYAAWLLPIARRVYRHSCAQLLAAIPAPVFEAPTNPQIPPTRPKRKPCAYGDSGPL